MDLDTIYNLKQLNLLFKNPLPTKLYSGLEDLQDYSSVLESKAKFYQDNLFNKKQQISPPKITKKEPPPVDNIRLRYDTCANIQRQARFDLIQIAET